MKKALFRAFAFSPPGIVLGVLVGTWCQSGATVDDVFGIAFGNIANKLLAEVHGNRARCFFAADKLTCPPKTDPHVKLEWWIKGRQ